MNEKKLTNVAADLGLLNNVVIRLMRTIGLALVFSLVACCLSLVTCYADDAEVKLNSNDGSTGFIIQNQAGSTVFRAGSDGSAVITGTATVNGRLGIGTTDISWPLSVRLNSDIIGINWVQNLNLTRSAGTSNAVGTGLLFTDVNSAQAGIYANRQGSDMTYVSDLVFLTQGINNSSASDPETLSERMRILSSGNVGIGTTNPSFKLDVEGGARFWNSTGGRSGVQIGLSAGSGTAIEGIASNGALTSPMWINYGSSGDVLLSYGGGNVGIGTGSPIGKFHVRSAGVDSISVSTVSGNVGIGTTSPAAKIDVNGTANMTALSIGGTAVTATATKLNFVNAVTSDIQTQLNSKAPIASPTFTGTVSGITATMVGLGNVTNTSDANKPVSTAQQTALNLKANLDSPAFTGTVSMPGGIWDSSGYVGIGTTSTGAKLHVQSMVGQTDQGIDVDMCDIGSNFALRLRNNSYNIAWFGNNGNVGIGTTSPGTYKLYVAGTGYLGASAWVYSSDRRLKENISYIKSGLDVVERLKPAKFDYINGEKKQAGFIAQDVQEVLPDIVTEGSGGMLGLKTDSIIPYLVKAIQEQQKEIEDLKTEIEKLKK